MARVEAVPEREAGLFGRFAYGLSQRRFGEVVEPLTVMAHHPRLLLGYGVFELAFKGSNLVYERLKSLAVLKVAAMVGCEFCMDIGSALSRGEGVTEEQLRELTNFEQSEVFSPLEKLVLGYAVAYDEAAHGGHLRPLRSAARAPQRATAGRVDHRDSAGELPGPVQPRLWLGISRVLGGLLLRHTRSTSDDERS